MKVKVIGAGLAGSEAAYQIAKRGHKVTLYEMRPTTTEVVAHHTNKYGELVCSNSLKNKGLYISTIGNINFYSAYYNILLPIFVTGFCKAVDKKVFAVFGSFIRFLEK